MAAQTLATMEHDGSPWVRLCKTHRAILRSGGTGRHERLRCHLCTDRSGRNRAKAPRAFILRNVKTGQEIVCPVRADEGIEE